jgi:hypothetical protein
MSNVLKTVVTLRFEGDDLNPDQLTEHLGATPTKGVAKGASWTLANGQEKFARTGQWHLGLEASSPGEELDVQVGRLFGQLTKHEDTWRELCGRFGGNLFVGLFLGSSNDGVVIGSKTLASIAAKGLELQFDIYGASDD